MSIPRPVTFIWITISLAFRNGDSIADFEGYTKIIIASILTIIIDNIADLFIIYKLNKKYLILKRWHADKNITSNGIIVSIAI